MELREIIAGGECDENDCPTMARIPASLILEAARALGG